MKKRFIRVMLGGCASALIMISTSMIVHALIFRSYWDAVHFMRSADTWQFMAGVPVSTILWNIVIAWFYTRIYRVLPYKGALRGLVYGLYLCALFVWFVELWNYFQFELPFMTVIAGVLTYVISLPLGGAAISVIAGDMRKAENKI